MRRPSHTCYVDIILWGLVVYLSLHIPVTETRTNEDDTVHNHDERPQASTVQPEPLVAIPEGSCFHMERAECPKDGVCRKVDRVSVFCCDVSGAQLKEVLPNFVNQNTSNLHVLNATMAELNVSTSMYRRLTHLAFTDGNIGKIVGQFYKYSPLACLNISNNNLTTLGMWNATVQRPFAYLFNLKTLDASANNLTEFPLSLLHSNRRITVDFSGNNFLPCKHFQAAMNSNNNTLLMFRNYEKTFCALDLSFNWFRDVQIVNIDHIKVQKEVNASCALIEPPNINCSCAPYRLLVEGIQEDNKDNKVISIAVDCIGLGLKEMPTNLPANTVKLNVSHNSITSLQAVADDPTYERLHQLIVDHNHIESVFELEGTKFIDNFMLFSITHNKLRTIPTYILSNRFDSTSGTYSTLSIAGNYIHCDCNTEKVMKPWLYENLRNIPDYKSLQCQDNMGPVVNLVETTVCHTPRDWTDYIYYIIGLEVLVLIILVTKVSYDYWVFKTAGYLPWPANKMPRLPCDWLCE